MAVGPRLRNHHSVEVTTPTINNHNKPYDLITG